MRAWFVLLVLAGCAAPPLEVEPAMPLQVYVFEDPAADTFLASHGVMMRVSNPTPRSIAYEVAAPNMTAGTFGPVGQDGWTTGATDTLASGESRLWLFDFGDTHTMHVYEIEVLAEDGRFAWRQHLPNAGGGAVEPGMHVVTYTVGVWTNGTSFYTNIASMNADPAFPAGYDRADFNGDGLRVYVYDGDRTEQPARSKDTCHFTTIPGYNELLKSQTEGGTGVRFLSPEEAYTTPGNEGHHLYGEPLVFMNRVAAIEERDERFDDVPDPGGACFDAQRYAPLPALG